MARTQQTGYGIEDDSLTGDDVQEETLEDTKIPFSNVGFSSLNLHEAIIEARNRANMNIVLTGYGTLEVLVDCSGNVLTEA